MMNVSDERAADLQGYVDGAGPDPEPESSVNRRSQLGWRGRHQRLGRLRRHGTSGVGSESKSPQNRQNRPSGNCTLPQVEQTWSSTISIGWEYYAGVAAL